MSGHKQKKTDLTELMAYINSKGCKNVKNESGITDKQIETVKAIPEIRLLGCFNVMENQI